MPKICPLEPDEIFAKICSGEISSYSDLKELLKVSNLGATLNGILTSAFTLKFVLGCFTCDNPIAVKVCETAGIETATLSGCWREKESLEKVSIEIIRDENGEFIHYEVHSVNGIEVVSDLSLYEPCPDKKIEPNQFPLCGGC